MTQLGSCPQFRRDLAILINTNAAITARFEILAIGVNEKREEMFDKLCTPKERENFSAQPGAGGGDADRCSETHGDLADQMRTSKASQGRHLPVARGDYE